MERQSLSQSAACCRFCANIAPARAHVSMPASCCRVTAVGKGWIELDRALPYDLLLQWQVGNASLPLSGFSLAATVPFAVQNLQSMQGAATVVCNRKPPERALQGSSLLPLVPLPHHSRRCTPLRPACAAAALRASPWSSPGVSAAGFVVLQGRPVMASAELRTCALHAGSHALLLPCTARPCRHATATSCSMPAADLPALLFAAQPPTAPIWKWKVITASAFMRRQTAGSAM